MVRSFVPHIVFLSLLLSSLPAAAQSDDDKQQANELAAEAVEAFQNDDFATAAERFAEAHSYYPQSSLKLNEMVAWYKADDCDSAMGVARWIESNVDGLTSADQKDLDRVSSDCSYREANALFESGDLEGASAILEKIETEDGEVALKVGRLQGKIEERKSVVVEPPKEIEAPVDEPLEPPPAWMRTAGFVSLGAGGALIVGGFIQTLVDKNTLSVWQEACFERPPDDADPDCVRDETGKVVDLPEAVDRQTNTANTITAVLIGAGSVGVITGGVLLTMHYLRLAKYEKQQANKQAFMVAPTLSTDGAGVVFQLRF